MRTRAANSRREARVAISRRSPCRNQVMCLIPRLTRIQLWILHRLAALVANSCARPYLGLRRYRREAGPRPFRIEARVHISGAAPSSATRRSFVGSICCQRVMVGVNVDVRPVAQIERRDRDRGRIIVVVIAARRSTASRPPETGCACLASPARVSITAASGASPLSA